jgi:tRNA 5-methylaminomethyl-2-thiouridine biosynthesis bifunctional protein
MRRTVFVAEEGDARALLQDPERAARLHIVMPGSGPLPGFRRVLQDGAAVTLDLLNGPLEQLDARLDAIYLGGAQGELPARALAKLSRNGTELHLDSATGAQRAALCEAGFAFDAPGHAVFATRKPQPPGRPERDRRAIVIGAGLAGAAACERLCARGWQVTLLERHEQPASEASGNHAGIVMPLLSKDDNIPTRLSRAAYLFALDYWRRLEGVEGARCGVLQLARDAAHAKVQREVIERWHYPAQFAQWLNAAQAGALLGFATPHGGWLFPQGGWADPASVCRAMLAKCGDALTARFNAGTVTLAHEHGTWRASGDGVQAEAPVVVLANGAGAIAMAQTASLPLSAIRGQVSHLAAGAVPDLPVVLCREAYLTPASRGIHCAGATYDDDGERALRQQSHDDNLARLRSLLGDAKAAANAPLAGRVGFRCVAPDRLPLVGALADDRPTGRMERLRDLPRQHGLYGLLGYASRGLTWAPLAAELLAAQLEGEPLPLEKTLVDALDPARFHLKRRR